MHCRPTKVGSCQSHILHNMAGQKRRHSSSSMPALSSSESSLPSSGVVTPVRGIRRARAGSFGKQLQHHLFSLVTETSALPATARQAPTAFPLTTPPRRRSSMYAPAAPRLTTMSSPTSSFGGEAFGQDFQLFDTQSSTPSPLSHTTSGNMFMQPAVQYQRFGPATPPVLQPQRRVSTSMLSGNSRQTPHWEPRRASV